MAFIVADRVQETATANTTVSFTLSGAIASYQSFSAIGNGNTTYYGATDGTNWEVGLGTYSTSPNTLTRTTILSSSNSGSAVTFNGAVTVWCDYPAGKQISSDYPNALGVVTPAAGTFTTITGQTEVLKGTGTNLLSQSQAWATTPWSTANGTTVANNVTTAPDGTTTASKISEPATTTSYFSAIQNPTTVAPSARYTHSFYAKSAERTQVFINNTVSAYTVYFDLSAGTVVGTSGANYISSAITSVGSGWYRCSVVFTASTSANPFYTLIGPAVAGTNTYSSTLGSGIYTWGAQLEIGSVVNTYIPTTTTAVYGTPTLSFSGVAGLGLQSDGSLYVSPAGTGALQAQATTSSAVGGNARGANAVDWQTLRNAATQVASGAQSVVAGGAYNFASAQYASVLGGYANNVNSSYSGTAVGGYNNSNAGSYAFIGGGFQNAISAGTANTFSFIGGGYTNSANGIYNFIGAGQSNSGTSITAVTTQSATMNATTAVTLAASNASIKVGQYITGTSIAGNTYVAAISGTSLTLSQAASGSSTSTLSFYTPHGVVVGGGNNQATGSYSFIGGGGDAGTAANRNVASGDWSFVGGGFKNTATGVYSAIAGGNTNTTGVNGYQFVGAGISNNASGYASSIIGGQGNFANSVYGSILGGGYGSTRSITGYIVMPANNGATGAYNVGGAQAGLLIVGAQTTTATPQILTSDNAAASGTNQVILPNNSAYYFKVSVIAGVTGGGNTKAWTLEGAIKRGSGVGTTAIVGTVTTTIVAADAGASTWTVTATADTTNGGLAITFTGQAGTTIRVVAKCETAEMTF